MNGRLALLCVGRGDHELAVRDRERRAIRDYQGDTSGSKVGGGWETPGQVLSFRGSCGLWMRTAGIVVGVRGDRTGEMPREWDAPKSLL